MERVFLLDPERSIQRSYQDLFLDLADFPQVRPLFQDGTPYLLFLELVASLVRGEKMELLDPDLSATERKRIKTDFESPQYGYSSDEIERFFMFEQLLDRIKHHSNDWRLSLYTSGTTGRPKKVTHSLGSLTRFVRKSKKHQSDVWAFAYNPTHFAGLQVFFQAFFNQNPMVYVFDMPRERIPTVLGQNKVTHLSATPTFFRSILPFFERPMLSLQAVTSGGEKFDSTLGDSLQKTFPNAKIRNVYASTEAGSLFAAEGDLFKIPEKKMEKFKILDSGELLVHKSYLGESEDFMMEGDWFHTGDIVQEVEAGLFRFQARKNEMINVGGYKVNPHEVEETLLSVPGIQEAIVFPKGNRVTGNILAADIVIEPGFPSVDEAEITRQISKHLQKWKIPRVFRFVEAISLSRTGKKERK